MEYFAECLKDFVQPENWANISYGNDACPSFEYNGYQIFVDHPDPKEREVGEDSNRYAVIISLEYGDTGWMFCTDNFADVLKEVEKPYLDRPLQYEKEEYLKEEARRASR
tara:strand:+ start:154 stop:483 length:330 start_codon:yes stop_codon:yes gene_type:complete